MAKRSVRPSQEEIVDAMLDFTKSANVKYPNSGFAFACGYYESALCRLLLESVPAATARQVVDQLIVMKEEGAF